MHLVPVKLQIRRRSDGNVETIASKRKKVIVEEDGGCAWKALTVPPVVPSVAAVAIGFAAVGGF